MASKELEKEWAKYKYWVMARSQHAYNDLRKMFKDNQDVDELEFYKIIDSLKDEYNLKAEVNAFQHVWGYFKKICTIDERNTYLTLLEEFKKTDNKERMYDFLKTLADKYEVTYLKDSYYFEENLEKIL